jgi:hypothetical protein
VIKDILYEKAEQRLLEKELDPKKSTRLAEWTGAEHSGSFRNDTETLYVNEKGDYFIVYEGGMKPGMESWFGGSYTRALSAHEAFAWCEETGNSDAIRDHLPFFMMSVSGQDRG